MVKSFKYGSLNEPSSPDPKMVVEDILPKLGQPGLYHVTCYAILCMFQAFISFNYVSLPATMGITPPHNCSMSPRYLSMLSVSKNTSINQLDFEQCHVIWRYNGTSRQVDCEEWQFGKVNGRHIESIVTKWNLVCKKKFYPELSNTVYFIGVMIGGGTIGHISDKYGRKPIILLVSFLSIVITSASVFVPDFIAFTAMRFFAGIVTCGFHNCIYVMAPEITLQKFNNPLSIILILTIFATIPLGAIVCWLTGNFWKSHLILNLPIFIPWLIACFFLPESFRWMVLHRRYKQLSYYVKKAAKINGVPPPDTTLLFSSDTLKSSKHIEKTNMSVYKVFTYPEIRRRLLSMFIVKPSMAIAFYTLALNMRTLSSDPYLAVVYSSTADLIPVALAYFLVLRFGKRRPVLLFLLIGGCFCVIYKFVDHLAIVMVGKMFCGISFGLIFVFVADIFPTKIRNLCLGMCVAMGRFGSIAAPQFVLLGVHTSKDIPVLLSGIFILLAAVVVYFLPEMSKLSIPDTIEDVENYKAKLKERKKEDSVAFTNGHSIH